MHIIWLYTGVYRSQTNREHIGKIDNVSNYTFLVSVLNREIIVVPDSPVFIMFPDISGILYRNTFLFTKDFLFIFLRKVLIDLYSEKDDTVLLL